MLGAGRAIAWLARARCWWLAAPLSRLGVGQQQQLPILLVLNAARRCCARCPAPRAGFVQPESRRNEVLGWVKQGVRDFSISRAAVEWGIPVPRDPKQTVYVWFDALNGYLSGECGAPWKGSAHGRPDGGAVWACCASLASSALAGARYDCCFVLRCTPPPWRLLACLVGSLPAGLLREGHAEASPEALATAGWPASVHIIGKDILRFHAVYWWVWPPTPRMPRPARRASLAKQACAPVPAAPPPCHGIRCPPPAAPCRPAMLMSAGLAPPRRVFGHGFLTKDGLKMGKSLGNVLEPTALVGAYGADAVRYYFLREIVFGQVGRGVGWCWEGGREEVRRRWWEGGWR